MRHIGMLSAMAALVLVPFAVRAQHDHSSPDQRGAEVMGFDQSRTTHHFTLFQDGGAIEASVNDPADAKNRDAIRSHLPHIAMMFGSGDFDAPMLVHDSKNVPGTNVMAARREHIRYNYVETPAGGRVNIVTTDAQALEAVHQFLKFQIQEHKTGDSMHVRTR